jgi:catechol 2,3-dioxygenase-like lactoylglutathione lyase family enzyme
MRARSPIHTDWTPTLGSGRRALVTGLAVGLLVLDLSGTAATGPAVGVTAVDSVGLTVSNLERSTAFFRDVLSFTVEREFEASGRDVELLTGVFGARVRTARLRLGREAIELTEFLAPRGRPYPADTRGNDRWFQHVAIITSNMDAAYRRLRDHGVPHASTGPQRLPDWNPNAGGISAFYFRDPDGHFLEVLQFPPGKGEARWQDHRALFLGIDHTAIVSSDTAQSLRFYRDGLGMAIAGGAENHGVEQEHLNNVFGVRLRITTLKATEGPGVELLEYLAPRDGRPAPLDLRANDLAHWQTTMVARDPAVLLSATFGGWLVSPDMVAPPAPFQFARGLLVRDPDAHGVRLVTH